MNRVRLDELMVVQDLAGSRSQAANLIRLGKVFVDGNVAKKPAQYVAPNQKVSLKGQKVYVSRAAYKLISATEKLRLDYRAKMVLDIGSSTGGFTEYVLECGAEKVVAIDVGSNQLHPLLRNDNRIELHEKMDIRQFPIKDYAIDMAVMDVSFISSREIIPTVMKQLRAGAEYVVMLKPQFEGGAAQKNKGVIKNEKVRRDILKDFESWVKQYAVIKGKADSSVSGAKGNTERFYLLSPLKHK